MNDFDSIIKRITVTRLEPGDYTGKDGLLYCGKCRTPKQFRMEAPLSLANVHSLIAGSVKPRRFRSATA